jgi:3-dehydroquinate dehydratase/shikimate dehydrogenase
VYLPLLVAPEQDVLNEFLEGCRLRPWLDVAGLSVTVPHKGAAARWVGQRIQPLAARIGAVNTLVPDKEGFTGHNTDYAGALGAITEALHCDRRDLRGLEVAVLGAGGVARAVVAGLRDSGCRVTIYNRHQPRSDALAKEFDCRAEAWEKRAAGSNTALLINCTSLGMWPDVDETPIPPDRLARGGAVFDAVYNPPETRLLREARLAGCRTIDGLSMFVHQAAAQFELWTGQQPDRSFMREIVEAQLSRAASP